jgi:hypothetical protein
MHDLLFLLLIASLCFVMQLAGVHLELSLP